MTTPKPPGIRSVDPRLIYGDFATFADEIGYVVWSWNELQADLCELFWIITGIQDPSIPRAIWNAIKSDSGQRDILIAAAQARIRSDTACREEVLWLVREVGQVSAFRNDAIHTLWTKEHRRFTTLEEWKIDRAIPDKVRGNPRGQRLENKDAKALFRALVEYSHELVQYSRFLSTRVMGWDEGRPLPDRPLRPPELRDMNPNRESSPQRRPSE